MRTAMRILQDLPIRIPSLVPAVRQAIRTRPVSTLSSPKSTPRAQLFSPPFLAEVRALERAARITFLGFPMRSLKTRAEFTWGVQPLPLTFPLQPVSSNPPLVAAPLLLEKMTPLPLSSRRTAALSPGPHILAGAIVIPA